MTWHIIRCAHYDQNVSYSSLVRHDSSRKCSPRIIVHHYSNCNSYKSSSLFSLTLRPFAIWLEACQHTGADIKQLTAGQAPISLARLVNRVGGVQRLEPNSISTGARACARCLAVPFRLPLPDRSGAGVPIDAVTARRVFGGESRASS